MNLAWLTGRGKLDEKVIFNNKDVLDKLRDLCYNKRNELLLPRLKDYDAAWGPKHAHRAGYIEALDYMISLCTLDPRDNK